MSCLSIPWHIACYVYQVCQDSVTYIALCCDICGCHCGIAADRMLCCVVGRLILDFPKDHSPFIFTVTQSKKTAIRFGLHDQVVLIFNFSATVTLFSLLYLCVLKTSDSLVHLPITFNIQLLYAVCATECFSLNGMFT